MWRDERGTGRLRGMILSQIQGERDRQRRKKDKPEIWSDLEKERRKKSKREPRDTELNGCRTEDDGHRIKFTHSSIFIQLRLFSK